MRVQLASPELHKRLRFLSGSSIKEKVAGNTTESLTEAPAIYYYTTAAASHSDVHNHQRPLHDEL